LQSLIAGDDFQHILRVLNTNVVWQEQGDVRHYIHQGYWSPLCQPGVQEGRGGHAQEVRTWVLWLIAAAEEQICHQGCGKQDVQ